VLQAALWEATDMAPHIKYFESAFLVPLARAEAAALAAKARDAQGDTLQW
jgi:hypothetical protein